jgi:hypothetical protein
MLRRAAELHHRRHDGRGGRQVVALRRAKEGSSHGRLIDRNTR